MQAVKGFVKRRAGDALVTLAIVVASLTVRFATLYPLDIGGDPERKWFFVRTWGLNHPWHDWEHHMTRMGINVPIWFVQTFLGTEAINYYVAPLAAATLFAIVMFFTARRLAGPLAGVFAALGAIMFDQLEHAGTQLNPEVFECLYGAMAIYCLVRYAQDEARRAQLAWLFGTAACMFLLYLTKEPNVFLFPGYAAAIWLVRRRLKDVVLLTGVIFGMFVVETALYIWLTPYPRGRMQIVSESYHSQAKRPWKRIVSFWGLFARYTRAVKPSWKYALYPFFALWPLVVFSKRFSTLHRALLPISLAFLLGITFYVHSFDPIITGTIMHQRYLAPLIPSMFLSLAVIGGVAITTLLEQLPPAARGLGERLSRFSAPLLALSILVPACVQWQGRNPGRISEWQELKDQWQLFNRAYAAGVPIVDKRGRRGYEYKTPFAIHQLLISDDNLRQPDGSLFRKPYRTVRVGKATYMYLHKEAKDDVAGPLVRKAIESKGCFIEVSARNYTLTIETSERQIEKCLGPIEVHSGVHNRAQVEIDSEE